MQINQKLKEYVENRIFPQYSKNKEGHGINHINYVIKRCFELSKSKDINLDLLYAIASYHDIGHHIDTKNHEVVSAQIMYADKNLREFFSEEELKIIKEAIEDHRASLNGEPRNIYGKIVSSADRNTSVEEALRRTYFYGKKHYPELSDEELTERAYEHLTYKFGENGYAKFFVEDEKYTKFLNEIRALLSDKEQYRAKYIKLIGSIKKEKAKKYAIKAHRNQNS